MNFDYAALERRLAALEASQSASLRFGRVTGVSRLGKGPLSVNMNLELKEYA